MELSSVRCIADGIVSLCAAAPPNLQWRRTISPSSWTKSSGTPVLMRSCFHVYGKTRSRPWLTSMNHCPIIPTEVKNWRKWTSCFNYTLWVFAVIIFVWIHRTDLSRRFFVLLDGSRDISGHSGQAGQVSRHDPTYTPLLYQVLPQHISNRSNTHLTSASKSLDQRINLRKHISERKPL